MNRLEKIVRAARPGAAVHLRAQGYGASDAEAFLRDVLALANVEGDGSRLIVMGVAPTASGARRFAPAHPPGHDRLDYQALVEDSIEPALQLAYHDVHVDGAATGVVQISGCQNRPYMMRIDHSASLRRGDAFSRVGNKAVKMGRAQLEKIFASKYRDNLPSRRIEVGFAGDFIVKDWRIAAVDLSQLPSAVARTKLSAFMDAQESASGTGSTTVVARLTHARLYGSDQPYEKRSRAQLMQELTKVGDEWWHDDQKYLFSSHGQDLDIVILNQGADAIENVEFSVTLPSIPGLYVASPTLTPLVAVPGYPKVLTDNQHIRISSAMSEVEPGLPVPVFERAARFCVSDELAGQRIPVEYTLTAANLQAPVVGRLHISL